MTQQIEAIAIAVLMPPPGTVVCPFLPPIPQMSKVTGQVNALQPLPCLGKQCALYEGCQGSESPKAAPYRRIGRLKAAILLTEKLGSLPFVGPGMTNLTDWLKDRIVNEEERLAASQPSQPEAQA